MIRINKLSSQRNHRRRGVTLLELAIALGVMGVVTAAIWATASVVRGRQPIHDTVQVTQEIANNLRSIYTGSALVAPAPTTAQLVAAGVFPPGILDAATGTTPLNAWNGAITVNFHFIPRLVGFSIEFTLPATIIASERRELCAGVATRMPSGSTTYAGGFVGALPAAPPAIDTNHGSGPALTLLRNNGAWKNVTGLTALVGAAATSFFGPTGMEDCTGFAVYYRL